jgi:D-alanyl-D-alanine dipeptidase
MKPYQKIPISECGEPLVPIPLEMFAVESPHPYQKLGAPYGERSPYHLRQSVINSLIQAQAQLQKHYPNWQIQIFDAYRPVAVQQFMVDYTFAEVVQAQGLTLDELTEAQHRVIWEQVYQIWAVPSLEDSCPPPHSTGGAVDVTLVDATGQTVNMGSVIDELSPASHPDYFANSADPVEQKYNSHRQLLWDVMRYAGFQRHSGEWWHFCLGDQMWAHLTNQVDPTKFVVARYGRIA